MAYGLPVTFSPAARVSAPVNTLVMVSAPANPAPPTLKVNAGSAPPYTLVALFAVTMMPRGVISAFAVPVDATV